MKAIRKLKYFHGVGRRRGTQMPKNMTVAMNVGATQITAGIQASFESERIAGLSGTHGDPSAGDPTELDVLVVELDEAIVNATVFNRGIALLLGDDEKIGRLHRFFEVIAQEIGT